MSQLKVGDKTPDFSLKDAQGRLVCLKDFLGKRPIVLYFYPKDESPGCTAQACSFRDHYEAFQEVGAEVIGISSDSIESHQKFSTHHKLPFLLLSDPKGKIRKLYGVAYTLGLIPGRVTFVLDKKGIVRHVFDSQLRATQHIQESLKIIQSLGRPLYFELFHRSFNRRTI
jgi:peroxiredoxin Q/BCP